MQLSRQIDIPIDKYSYLLTKLARNGILQCLNANARRGRLFWFTDQGQHYHQQLRDHFRLPAISYDLPDIDWELLGSCCFSHRATVIKTLIDSVQPAQIKRKALQNNPKIRMSANNVRDVIRYLREKRIVQPVKVRKKSHLHYELTEQGVLFRNFLIQAEVNHLRTE